MLDVSDSEKCVTFLVWMPAVAPQPNCPPGMEYLTQLDQVLIQQETHMLEGQTSNVP